MSSSLNLVQALPDGFFVGQKVEHNMTGDRGVVISAYSPGAFMTDLDYDIPVGPLNTILIAWEDGTTGPTVPGNLSSPRDVLDATGLPLPLTADDLADGVRDFIDRATERITGIGADQYDNEDGQKFERLPINDLFDWADEELLDIANYAAMLSIRLRRIKAGVDLV